MSPETMKGVYTSQADLWSIGVCTYILLSGGMKPFEAKTPKDLVARVLLGSYTFDDLVWSGNSSLLPAQQFIGKLLEVNPSKRPSAVEALRDPWLEGAKEKLRKSIDQSFVDEVRKNMIRYADSTAFRKLALNVVAKRSTSDEIFELRKVFDEFDPDHTGFLTIHQFKMVLKEQDFPDEDIEEIFRKVVGVHDCLFRSCIQANLSASLDVLGETTRR
jgi:calcium-dependent protein kinase